MKKTKKKKIKMKIKRVDGATLQLWGWFGQPQKAIKKKKKIWVLEVVKPSPTAVWRWMNHLYYLWGGLANSKGLKKEKRKKVWALRVVLAAPYD
jgi:hypothetical protein